jgi:hypothetical protein
MSGTDARQLRLEIRGRRMSLLLALGALVRGQRITNPEEVVLGRAVDLLTDRAPGDTGAGGVAADPTVPDVLRLIEAGPDELHTAARARGEGEYRRRIHDLVPTLALLCEGSLRRVDADQPPLT